jgi:putative copper export protein
LLKLLIIATLAVIVFNLGAGLIYLLKDDSDSERTVRALTRRIGISVALFAFILLLIATGVIDPQSGT